MLALSVLGLIGRVFITEVMLDEADQATPGTDQGGQKGHDDRDEDDPLEFCPGLAAYAAASSDAAHRFWGPVFAGCPVCSVAGAGNVETRRIM